MKNKKLITIIASLALVAVIGIGTTLAYFTDNDAAKNVITMGHVDIELTEPNFPEDKEVENIKPGDVIVKDPTITVADDSEDAYVRLELKVTGDISDAQKAQLLEKDEDGQYKYLQVIDTAKWQQAGDYFYYNGILKAGDEVVLFEKVCIPAEWDNSVADKTFNIELKAEAIQAENVTPDTDADGMIVGWPEAEILQYTNE